MSLPLIENQAGILCILAANAALWFYLQKRTNAALFNYVPPLLFIYVLPAVFSNTHLIPSKAPLYGWMGDHLLPVFIVLLLLNVDVRTTVRVMGRGIFVMLLGTLGVVVGAPVGYFIVKGWLGPEAWRGFGALAGSWVGGTANMAAVAEALGTSGEDFGLAVIADNAVYLIWLPILLQSKHFSMCFHRFTGVSRHRLTQMRREAEAMASEKAHPEMRHYMYLVAIGFGASWIASGLAGLLPEIEPVLSESTWRILLVTTLALVASLTPARGIPGSHDLAMALVYLFVARMGARASMEGLAGQALPFVAGAFVWIFVHGFFILAAARIFRIDIHTAAIASAANIGGAASAPIVAAYHDERLVPVAILMALAGYAIGNYAALLAAWLCSLLA